MKRSRLTAPLAGVLCGLATVAAAALTVPAIAHDGGRHDHDGAASPPAAGAEADPTIVPEPVDKRPPLKVTRELLADAEAELDPAGTAAVFVCGDEGSDRYTVVAIKRAAPDARAAASPERRRADDVAPIDPCAGKDLVVGKRDVGVAK